MEAAISWGLVWVQLAEEMLAQIDGLADAATASIGEHAGVGFAIDLDAGHAAAVGVFMASWAVIRILAKHGCRKR